MPTKRSRRGRHLRAEPSLTLNPRRRGILETGCDFFPAFDMADFADETQKRAAWERHRDLILAEWDTAGRRPWAFWQYDVTLPEEMSESEAVRALLLQGDLEPVTRHGVQPVDDEVAAIEKDWLRWIGVVVGNAWAAGDRTLGRGNARDSYGVPGWFFDQHAPRIAAAQAAEREAYYRSLRRGGDVA